MFKITCIAILSFSFLLIQPLKASSLPLSSAFGKALQKGKETQHMNSVRNFLINIGAIAGRDKKKNYTKAAANKALSQISQLSPSDVYFLNTDRKWSKVNNSKTPLICTRPTLLRGVIIVGWGDGHITTLKGNFKNLKAIKAKLKK